MEPTQQNLSLAQLDVMMQPLHPDRVKTRAQGGTSLSYLTSFDVRATLIRVFGFGGFSAEVIDSKMISIREHPDTPTHCDSNGRAKTPQAIAQATVRLTIYGLGPQGQDVVYTETAIGSNSGWDIGDICDNAIKTSASDALKRCAINLGSTWGLGLYDAGSKAEVVQVIFEPKQAEMLAEIRASQAAAMAEQAAAAQALLERATSKAPDSSRPPTQEALDVPGAPAGPEASAAGLSEAPVGGRR